MSLTKKKKKKCIQVLFFSTHCYSSDSYDMQYAFSSRPDGPYTRAGQLYKSNDNDKIYGPGHMDIAEQETIAFHARNVKGNPKGSKRYMYSGRIAFA